MSTGVESDLRDQAQKAGNQDTAITEHLRSALLDVHTALPGIVDSYDPATQTASVQPAIKRVFNVKGAVPLPLCVDVPVVFPGGGDFHLTFPIAAGDECLLIFSERCIDYWYANGGVQLPAEYRLHDLSDAFAVVGVNSQPKKLTNVQTDGVELRTRDRGTYLKVKDGSIHIKGDVVVEGSITQSNGSVTSNGKNVGHDHSHSGVVQGTGNTGGPI